MMLGPVKDGAVRLLPHSAVLVVCEGIETGLSVLQATQIPVWAALSTTGLESLVLPPISEVSEVVICADNDPPGIASARRAAQRWNAEGRRVRIAIPPQIGTDFNDLALGEVERIER